jgi:hypothetical protein
MLVTSREQQDIVPTDRPGEHDLLWSRVRRGE